MRAMYFIAFLICLSCSSSDDQGTTVSEEMTTEEPTPTNDDTPNGTLYFPPTNSDIWETTTPEMIGWDTTEIASLHTFLIDHNTKAFIVLKDGRIVIEAYYNGTVMSDNNPWFSAGKTLTSFITGMAQDDGFLSIDDTTSSYLGDEWTAMTLEQEQAITIRNQLTMTSGGDYTVSNTSCTDPECLLYLNAPSTDWYYHNAFYTLLQPVLHQAIPQGFDAYFDSQLKNVIGMNGAWIDLGFNRVYFSTARSMARFGLLHLNEGNWDGTPLISSSYFNEMITSSQSLNPAYGYLWWLNGKDSYRLPSSTTQFSGSLIPNAPDDLIAGLGANDQKLYIIPSKNLVIIRMGDSSGMEVLGPSGFDNELWEKINAVIE